MWCHIAAVETGNGSAVTGLCFLQTFVRIQWLLQEENLGVLMLFKGATASL
jgi:hypothetical protein